MTSRLVATVVALPQAFHATMDPTGTRALVAPIDGGLLLASATSPSMQLLPGVTLISVGFSADGRRAIGGGVDGVSRVWDVANPNTPPVVLQASSTTSSRTAFSPDGARVLTGTIDGTVRVWSLPDGPTVLPLSNWMADPPPVPIQATSVAFSPDGRTILTAARDGLARTWDAATGREIPEGAGCRQPPLGDHCLGAQTQLSQALWLTDAIFSRNGKRIATAGQFGSVAVWNAADATEVSRAPGVTHPVDAIAFSADGTRLATGERDGSSRLIDVPTGRVLATLAPTQQDAGAVAFTPVTTRSCSQVSTARSADGIFTTTPRPCSQTRVPRTSPWRSARRPAWSPSARAPW